ncbi:hypothetical protein GGX14DRAFT_377608, partial [Mycena pura]
TSTLTQNSMAVIAGSVGIHAKFICLLENNEARTNADGPRKHLDDFSLEPPTLLSRVLIQMLQWPYKFAFQRVTHQVTDGNVMVIDEI